MTQTRQAMHAWHETREKWAKIWFGKLAQFHRRKPQPTWEFTPEEVIAFLRSHLQRGTPAWKRLKIIESLIWYRLEIQKGAADPLRFIQRKLDELARAH